jgi:hypothetical protein
VTTTSERHERDRLTVPQGLAALSLDALASVAYGPEAIVVVLAVAGSHGLGFTLPVTVATNLYGIAESARILIAPAVVFVLAVLAVVAFGLSRPHPLVERPIRRTPRSPASACSCCCARSRPAARR